MTVAVELTRTSDAQEILTALSAHGLDAHLMKEAGQVLVEADDLVGVEHALEEWILDRGVPFVPFHVDGHTLALAPPPS